MAPLTFDEIRRFHGLLPKPESWEWSATPWSTPCVDEDDTWVMGLYTNGNVSNDYCRRQRVPPRFPHPLPVCRGG